VSPWNRELLEKLIIAKLVEKFIAFHGTGKCSTIIIASHWILSDSVFSNKIILFISRLSHAGCAHVFIFHLDPLIIPDED
jgi:hypothetical protein